METKAEIKNGTIIKDVLIDVKIEADISRMIPSWSRRSPVEYAKAAKDAIKEFQDFLRDHRSQDMVRLEIIEKRGDICSNCENEIETFNENNQIFCAHCGALLKDIK